jgi:hypothetical protein
MIINYVSKRESKFLSRKIWRELYSETKYLSYWKDVLKTCQEILTNKKQVNA